MRARPFQETSHLFFAPISLFVPRQDSEENGLSRRTVIARASSTGIHFEDIGGDKTGEGRKN